MSRHARRRRFHRTITRDAVLFASGLSGVFYETVFDKTDRPTLLLLFGAMMGLPAFLRTDEQAKDSKHSGDSGSGSGAHRPDDPAPPPSGSHEGSPGSH